MAQPTTYTRQADFSDHSTNSPTTPHVGTDLDAEFDALKTTLDEILTNMAILQRDDTELANETVGSAQLKSGISVGVNPATTWATATVYTVNTDLVWQSGKLYLCAETHTSGTFSTDLAASKWTEVLDLASEVPAVSGIMANSFTTLNNTGSPYTLTESDNGKAYLVDTSSGNVTVNLPDSAGLTDGDFVRFKFVRVSASNTFSIARGGSDTINGATSQTVTAADETHVDVMAAGSTEWKYIEYNSRAWQASDLSGLTAAVATRSDQLLIGDADDSNNLKKEGIGDMLGLVLDTDMTLTQQADVSSGTGTTTLDMTAGSYRKVTATGNISIDITPRSTSPGGYVLEAVNFGAHTITWTGVDNWAGGSAPTLTSSGTDLLGFVCEDGGSVFGYVIGLDMQ